MFCDGQCTKGKKTCGMMMELVMENKKSGKVEVQKKCCLHAMVESLHRLEQGDIRLQAAVESSRNESVKMGNKVTQVIAQGFGGLVDAAKNGPRLLEGE